MCKNLLLALGTLAALAGSAAAQGGVVIGSDGRVYVRNGRCQSTYYGQQVCGVQSYDQYQTQYAQTQYAQTQYNGNYYPPAHKVVAQDQYVQPLIIAVPVQSVGIPAYAAGNTYYYSANVAYNQKAQMRQVIREELERAGMAGVGAEGPPQRPAGLNQRPAPGVQAPPAGETTADQATPLDLQAKVLTAYKSEVNCLRCHDYAVAQAKGAGFRLTTQDGKLARQISDKRWKVYGMVSVGAMPPEAAEDGAKAMKSVYIQTMLEYAAVRD